MILWVTLATQREGLQVVRRKPRTVTRWRPQLELELARCWLPAGPLQGCRWPSSTGAESAGVPPSLTAVPCT